MLTLAHDEGGEDEVEKMHDDGSSWEAVRISLRGFVEKNRREESDVGKQERRLGCLYRRAQRILEGFRESGRKQVPSTCAADLGAARIARDLHCVLHLGMR